MARARGSGLCRRKKYLATTSDNRFDFSRSDDDFEELAKGFQLKNTRYQTDGPWKSTASGLRYVGSVWMSRLLPKWACWLTTETRCAKNCANLRWKSKLIKPSIHRGASSYFCVDCSDTSDRRGHKRQLTSRATGTYTTAFTWNWSTKGHRY